MGRYKIEIKPSNLPDSKDRKDLVLVAVDNNASPREGECLSPRTNYHVTVIDDEGLSCPGQTLHVGASEEGHYVFILESLGGSRREITPAELSELTFEFVSTRVTT